MDWISVLVSTLLSVVGTDEVRWAGVLGRLDAVRAEAFATADPSLLNDVYAPLSAPLRADVDLIDDYRRRGARVEGAVLTLLSCTVKRSSSHRVVLDLVDRLSDSRVVWADGSTRALPHDLPTRRVVTLVRTRAGWRIHEVVGN